MITVVYTSLFPFVCPGTDELALMTPSFLATSATSLWMHLLLDE